MNLAVEYFYRYLLLDSPMEFGLVLHSSINHPSETSIRIIDPISKLHMYYVKQLYAETENTMQPIDIHILCFRMVYSHYRYQLHIYIRQ